MEYLNILNIFFPISWRKLVAADTSLAAETPSNLLSLFLHRLGLKCFDRYLFFPCISCVLVREIHIESYLLAVSISGNRCFLGPVVFNLKFHFIIFIYFPSGALVFHNLSFFKTCYFGHLEHQGCPQISARDLVPNNIWTELIQAP